jgi:NitT/TauT family transport system substrate-binding protein
MGSRLRPIHEFPALSRREFLRGAAGAGLAGAGAVLLGGCGSGGSKGSPTRTPEAVADPPPETTTIRLPKDAFLPRLAPLYLAEQFLSAEGFTDVQYIDLPYITPDLRIGHAQQLATGELDIGLVFAHSLTVAADAGEPLVALAGVQTSVFVLFGNDGVQSLRDLKGKRLFVYSAAASDPAYAFWAALLAYVGIDVKHEVETVELSGNLLVEAQAGKIDAWTVLPPIASVFKSAKVGHVVLDGMVDPPWSQYFGAMATGNRGFVEQHPVATKRALRAILKATDVCAREPERAARYLVEKGFTKLPYDLALDGIPGRAYAAWREFNPEDTMRFYALRLKEAGLVKSTPDELISRATDWRYLNEIKRELGAA